MTKIHIALAGLGLAASCVSPSARILDARLHHLGDSDLPTWTDVPAEPEGTRLDLSFEAAVNMNESVLSLRHRDVDQRWALVINDIEVATLPIDKAMRRSWFALPAGTLADGTNTLTLSTDKVMGPLCDLGFGASDLVRVIIPIPFARIGGRRLGVSASGEWQCIPWDSNV